VRLREVTGGLCLALLSFAGGVRPAGLGDVRSISVADSPTQTRVVIELSQQAAYAIHTIENPMRVYVDVDGVWIDGNAAAPQPGSAGSLLRVVRGGQNTLTRARIVLELGKTSQHPNIYTLQNPYRIVAELPKPVTAPLPQVAALPKGSAETAPALEDWDRRGVRRIVLDAGHGGKDPGAIGVNGLREAGVVLAIAHEVEQQLTERGFEVILTRAGDTFLQLGDRTDIANKHDADLFLSIHANAAKSRQLAGVETYLLDTRYDRQTARVAARENGTTVAGLSDLHRILASLKLGNNERYAARYANLVQSALVRRLRTSYSDTIDLGVKRGPFLVLFQADMPAILVEVGFVSNPGEGGRLRSAAFARTAAEGIADGVSAYREQQERRLLARR
jgi:N-acetylmuramoyl-L-alanine amidase